MSSPGIIGYPLPLVLGLGSPLALGGSVDTAAEMRSAAHQHFVHVMFIEGISYVWTDDESGELWGSGLNSWIGRYENGQAWESLGQREVLPGLTVPDLSQARNPKTGQPVQQPVTIKLQDNAAYRSDNVVAGLFADSSKPYDVLGATVSAGTSNLAASITAWGSGASLNPRGRWIGVERIGSGGQRAQFYPLPIQAIGYEHAVQPNVNPPDGLPLVAVSDDPIVWEGRKVTIYRIHRNPDSTNPGIAAWPTWDEQDAAGNLVWWGVLQGQAKVSGGQTWELSCHGWDSWLQRKLNQNTTPQWYPVTASLQLSTAETGVAIVLSSVEAHNGTEDGYRFRSSVFDRTITATNKADLITELNWFIEDVLDGSDVNVNLSDGIADNWTLADSGGNVSQNPDAGITDNANIFVYKDNFEPETGFSGGNAFTMHLVLHSTVWETLGYEPSTQNAPTPHDSQFQAHFKALESGELYDARNDGSEVVPGEGYWQGVFSTLKLGYELTAEDQDKWDNDGQTKYYAPAFPQSSTFVLDSKPGQEINLGYESVYAEPQNTLIPLASAEVDGSPTDAAKLAVFRGKRLPVSEHPSDAELEEALDNGGEDFYAVAQVSWVNSSQGVGTGGGATAAVHIDRWLDARAFGFDTRAHDRGWVGASSGPAKIEMAFLSGWPWMVPGDGYAEPANALLTTLMLSSGTGTGYTGATLDEGDNSPNASPNFQEGGDWEIADLGLAIPYQMVVDPADIREAFETVPGGAAGALCQVRHAYQGPLKAMDVIDGLLRPRRLGWTLHGRQYGIQRLGPKVQDDVQQVIGEDDLAGVPGDPTTVIPTAEPGRLGSFDDAVLTYRWKPDEGGELAEEYRAPARDHGARLRSGAQELPLSDPGLLPYRWFTDMHKSIGVQPWHELFKELWSYETASYFAARHHMVTLKVRPHIALDCRVGTVVRLNLNWPASPDGTYGLTNAVGTIESATYHPGNGTATLKIMVFGGPFYNPPHFSPIAHITAWTDDVVTVDADYFGHGTGRHDAVAFEEPDWSSVGGRMDVEIWERSGTVWTVIDAGAVNAVDTGANTITLTANVPSTVLRDTDKFLVGRSYSNQGTGNWHRALMGYVCDDTLSHSSGVQGRQYI